MKSCERCKRLHAEEVLRCECGAWFDEALRRDAELRMGEKLYAPPPNTPKDVSVERIVSTPVQGGYGCFVSGLLAIGALRALVTMAAAGTDEPSVLVVGRFPVLITGAVGLWSIIAIYLRKAEGFYSLVGLNISACACALIWHSWSPLLLAPFVGDVLLWILLSRAGLFSKASQAKPILIAVFVSLTHLYLSILTHARLDPSNIAL